MEGVPTLQGAPDFAKFSKELREIEKILGGGGAGLPLPPISTWPMIQFPLLNGSCPL